MTPAELAAADPEGRSEWYWSLPESTRIEMAKLVHLCVVASINCRVGARVERIRRRMTALPRHG